MGKLSAPVIEELEQSPRHTQCFQAGANIAEILRLNETALLPEPDLSKSQWFTSLLADLVLASNATEDEKDRIVDMFRDIFIPPGTTAPHNIYNTDLYSFVSGMSSTGGVIHRREVAKLLQDVNEDFVVALLDLFCLFKGRLIWPVINPGAVQRKWLHTERNISVPRFIIAFGHSTFQGGLVQRLDTKAEEAGGPRANADLTRIELFIPYKRVEDEPRSDFVEERVLVSMLCSLRPIDPGTRIVYTLPADQSLAARRSRLLRKGVDLGCKLVLLLQDGIPREVDLHVLRNKYDDCVKALTEYELGLRFDTDVPIQVLIISAADEYKVRRDAVSAASKDLQTLSSYLDLCRELRHVRDALRQLR